MEKAIRIHPSDSVAVALCALQKGETALGVLLQQDIPAGHKFALRPIAQGENIIKVNCFLVTVTNFVPLDNPFPWNLCNMITAKGLCIFKLCFFTIQLSL